MMDITDKPVPMSVDMGCGKGVPGIIHNPLTGHNGYFDGCHRWRHTARGEAAKMIKGKKSPAWDKNCDAGRNYFEYMARQFNDSIHPNTWASPHADKDREHKKMVLFGTRLYNFVEGMLKIKHQAFTHPGGWWKVGEIQDEYGKWIKYPQYYNDTVMEWLDILKKDGWGGPGNPDQPAKAKRIARQKAEEEARIAAGKSLKARKNWKKAVKKVVTPKLVEVAKIAQQAKEEEEALKSYKEFTENSVRGDVFWTWDELSEEQKKQWKEKNHGEFGQRLIGKEDAQKEINKGKIPYENYVKGATEDDGLQRKGDSPFAAAFGNNFHKPWNKLTKRAQNDWIKKQRKGDHGQMLERQAGKYRDWCGPYGPRGNPDLCKPGAFKKVSKWTWEAGDYWGGKRRRRTKKKRKRRRKRTNKKKKRRRKRTKKKRR